MTTKRTTTKRTGEPKAAELPRVERDTPELPPVTTDTTTAPDVVELGRVAAEAAPEPTPAADQAPPEKRKSGWPKGKPRTGQKRPPAPTGPPSILPRSAVAAIIKAPYELAARRLGDHWRLTDQEAEGMVDVHLALADEYLPGFMRERPALYGVILVHLLTIFGKTEIHYRLQAEAERQAPETAAVKDGVRPFYGPYSATIKPGPSETPS